MRVLRRVLITVFFLIMCVPVAASLALATFLHFAWAKPDVHKQIRSADFQQAHAAAVAATDGALTTFVSTAPHATRLATAIRDRCRATSDMFAAKPTTKCARDVTVYLALDGDLAALDRAWTTRLTAAGWTPRDPAQPPSTFQPFESGRESVRLQWHTRPTPDTPIGDFQKGVPEKDYDGEVTLQQQPVDVAEVYRDAYAHHRYVVELWADNQYYPPRPRPKPSPTPSSTWNGCFGGHGNCPGG